MSEKLARTEAALELPTPEREALAERLKYDSPDKMIRLSIPKRDGLRYAGARTTHSTGGGEKETREEHFELMAGLDEMAKELRAYFDRKDAREAAGLEPDQYLLIVPQEGKHTKINYEMDDAGSPLIDGRYPEVRDIRKKANGNYKLVGETPVRYTYRFDPEKPGKEFRLQPHAEGQVRKMLELFEKDRSGDFKKVFWDLARKTGNVRVKTSSNTQDVEATKIAGLTP